MTLLPGVVRVVGVVGLEERMTNLSCKLILRIGL
jgi:hypothetical protein